MNVTEHDPFDSLRIRLGEPGDLARVRKDWLITYAKSDFARYLTPRPDWGVRASQVYWELQKAIVDELLRRAEVWIATWEEAPTSIAGWAVMELNAPGGTPVVHFVNVLPVYRRHGVARRLLAPALDAPSVLYTHRMTVCRALPIPPGWKFDPRPALAPALQERAA